jgi:heme-degrading monooxygenase HmoA
VFARLHTLETTEEQYEEGLRLVRDELLPWARESSGFRGLIGLVDPERTRALVLTFWADEESFRRSAGAGDELSMLAAEASGANRRSLQDYEVSIFDVSD